MFKFNVGDKVRCVADVNYQLTHDKIYEILEVTFQYVVVLDDFGVKTVWLPGRFEHTKDSSDV